MKKSARSANLDAAKTRRRGPPVTPSDLKAGSSKDIAAAMNGIPNTKNFHWHVSGPHARMQTTDETERRTWFLFDASRPGDSTGH